MRKTKAMILIESVLYLALLSIFLGLIGGTVNAMLAGSNAVVERNEVLANIELVERKLEWLNRVSSGVQTPPPAASSTSVSLLSPQGEILATASLAVNQVLLATATSTTSITNNRVRISQFLVEHFSSSQASSTVRITLGAESLARPNVSSTATMWFTFH